MIPIDFSGQVVLVTGGASGLGFAISEAFGRAGATIALNDRSPDRAERAAGELSRAGTACRGFTADVRDAMAVRSMVDRVVTELGPPAVTVVNAGIYPNTPFLELPE
ncbi:MAG TPA: SDR family NAD(P)-dependent oxidoreductase, partial [Thermomicrobiales bacterium]|nr:SDR family NAD(P)-dependent oxidoreductase [Thermomicrobiales bacterium]